MSRFRYALLLTVALMAIYIGLWPSLLSVGALLGIVVALACGVGLAAPMLAKRWRLHRLAFLGGGVLALELALVIAWLAWTPRRPVLLVLGRPTPARVRVVYGVADGTPRVWWRWGRRLRVPAAGVVYTRYAMDDGWFRPENQRALLVIVQGPGAPPDTVPGRWIAGGTTRRAGAVWPTTNTRSVARSTQTSRRGSPAPAGSTRSIPGA